MPSRLVILGSGVTALAVARNAHRNRLSPVVFDTQTGTASKTSLAQVEIHPGATDVESVNVLRKLGSNRKNLLIATGDDWLRFLVRYRPELNEAYREILHPSNDTLNICLSKSEFASWCKANGISSPELYQIDPNRSIEAQRIEFPVLLRPAITRHTERSKLIPKAVEVRSAPELRHWLDVFASENCIPAVCESLLNQDVTQYSIGAARSGDSIVSFVAKKVRPHPESCEGGSYVELSPNAEAEALARKCLHLLRYHGIAEVEVFHSRKTGRTAVVEINARPWVQYALASASGHDLLRFMTDLSNYDAALEVKRGKTWIDFGRDAYVCFAKDGGLVRRGKISFWRYLASLSRVNVCAKFSASDLRPFWSDLRVGAKKLLRQRAIGQESRT
ncbi:MAG TPA: hypothetical protein VLD83_03230 [Candidatus Binatia bacterium]|nr:hypothetical protein [Candidatus Binatia bacterium]